MLSKVISGTTIGLHGVLITVEVDVASGGFPSFKIVGLPNKAIEEAKERVRTALVNAGFNFPRTRVVVNLSPADIPKEGSHFDLPIALGILASKGDINHKLLQTSLFVGELSLDGKLLSVPGILPIATKASEQGIQHIFTPDVNTDEAALAPNISIYGVSDLYKLVQHLNEIKNIKRTLALDWKDLQKKKNHSIDFKNVRGQHKAKRALEIAAAGGHNVLLKGPPGTGKTMLAKAFPTILPELDEQEVVDLSHIYSITHKLRDSAFKVERPFRSPHHTISRTGLIGGGSQLRPGEITLAHRGVLFLDEFPEYPRSVLEALRQPMEDGVVTITRVSGTVTYPARFMLLAAANPCPCGYLGHKTRACTCSSHQITRYKKKVSGPILDRIDIHADVPPVKEDAITNTRASDESSSTICERVENARQRQLQRFKSTTMTTNAEMNTHDIQSCCALREDAQQLLSKAYSKLSLSARAYFKIIKVSQTIADIENSNKITAQMISEALQYRPA